MEINKHIQIMQLDVDGVIIHNIETIDYNGKIVTISDIKTYYPNDREGRYAFLEDVQDVNKNICDAVLLVWGNSQEEV